MESLQHDVGGPPPLSSTLNFKDALTAHVLHAPPPADPTITLAMQDLDSTPTGLHRGSPAIFFRPKHLHQLNKPFEWSLIGKFSQGYNRVNPKLGRPSIEHIREHFTAMDLKGEFKLGLLDNRHVLIHLKLQVDYLRLYSRPVWYIGGMPMRVFKWSEDFHVDKESSIAPIWVGFPRLPVQFFQQDALFAISRLLGVPLRLDAATATLKRPSMARVQIEIDVLKSRPDKIWIGMSECKGFWQRLEYENVPDYCTHCWHMGHSETLCTVHHPELKNAEVPRAKQPKQVYVKKGDADHKGSASRAEVPSGQGQQRVSVQAPFSSTQQQVSFQQHTSFQASDSSTQHHPPAQHSVPNPTVQQQPLAPVQDHSPLIQEQRPVFNHKVGFAQQVEIPESSLAAEERAHLAPKSPSRVAGPELSSEPLALVASFVSEPTVPTVEDISNLGILEFGDDEFSLQHSMRPFQSLDDLHLHRMPMFQTRDLVISGLKEFCKRLSPEQPSLLALEDVPKRRGRPRKTILQQAESATALLPSHSMVTRSIGSKSSLPQ